MVYSVAIAGGTGYAGGEALRIVTQHKECAVTAVTGRSSVGESLSVLMPHIPQCKDMIVQDTTPEVLNGHDIIILALPHGASGELASHLSEDALVIDLGADHRLESEAQWNHYYGGDYYSHWTYGMPELLVRGNGKLFEKQRSALKNTRRIAGPGCNVTATTLALQPALAYGCVDTKSIVSNLAVGYSGAGKNLKRTNLLASEALGSAVPYGVGGQHRHIPEIIQNFAHVIGCSLDRFALSFTPILVPMSRGILAAVTAPLTEYGASLSQSDLYDLYASVYDEEQFIDLMPPGMLPATANVIGSNMAHIQVVKDEISHTLTAFAAIDNLNRGTAGQAVQAMNIALGMSEETGLSRIGVAP